MIQKIKEWSGVVVLVLLVVLIGFWAGTSWSKTTTKITTLEIQVQEDRKVMVAIENFATQLQQAQKVGQPAKTN